MIESESTADVIPCRVRLDCVNVEEEMAGGNNSCDVFQVCVPECAW
jgi:hypothetical protein